MPRRVRPSGGRVGGNTISRLRNTPSKSSVIKRITTRRTPKRRK